MKLFIFLITVFVMSTCNSKVKKMGTGLSGILEQKKTLEVYEINYGDYHSNDTSFHEGYSVKNSKMLNKSVLEVLTNKLKDSANYSLDKSKNCVLAASYGIKASSDTAKYIVFIGKQPCMKLSILDATHNSESTFDLSENNTIVPFFDSLFTK